MNPSTKLILSTLLSTLSDFRSTSVEHTIDKVAIALRREILHIGSRLLGGGVLACLIVLSFVQMADAVDAINSQFDNGPIFSLLAFGVTTALAGIAFYFVLRPGPMKPAPSETQSGINFELLALKFAEGAMDGLNQPIQTDKPNVEKTMVSNTVDHAIDAH